jgi:DNA-binding NtrC family response regulator
MGDDYRSIIRPDEPMPDADEIGRIGLPELASLLAEWAARDSTLRRRLYTLLAASKSERAGRQAKKPQHIQDFATADANYLVGASPVMKDIYEAIRKYAPSNAPVLILGETGTGKELVARALHQRSPQRDGPFVAINCGAIPHNLVGSELFGFEKGSFTGAMARKIGRVEAANGGTVFFDEIGDLPLDTQIHLLRFLQEKTIERIGGHDSITINARVIAATNIDLKKAVGRKDFREDLYYRLNVLTLSMPPLRDRGSDIALLAKFYLKRFADELSREAMELSPEALALVGAYPWPGNVRELVACIRRAVVMADGLTILAEDLGIPIRSKVIDGSVHGLGRARGDAEASLVRQTLENHHFNMSQTAKKLNVSRATLYRLVEKHGIELGRERFHGRTYPDTY